MTEPVPAPAPAPPDPPAEVVERVAPLISMLPRETQREILHIVMEERFSGPLPHPRILAQYGEQIPNGADRIMNLLELQTSHRTELERTVVQGRVQLSSRGQWMAFLLSMFFGCVAAYFGYLGHTKLAGIVLLTTITTLLAVFVLGRLPGKPAANEPEPEPGTKRTSAPQTKRAKQRPSSRR
jgi:uncharacterized membrane protein